MIAFVRRPSSQFVRAKEDTVTETIPREADWNHSPNLIAGATTLELTAAQCHLDYWFSAVPHGTLKGLVRGHLPQTEVPEYMLRAGPLREAIMNEFAFRSVAEERAARAIGYIVACAPDVDTTEFFATQLIDEVRHARVFRGHLLELGVSAGELFEVIDRISGEDCRRILTPLEEFALPMVRDQRDFIAGVVMLTILLEGVLAPAAELSERKWRLLDPPAAQIERGANIDEIRHLTVGSAVVRQYLLDHPEEKPRVGDIIWRGRELWAQLPTAEVIMKRELLFQEGLAQHADVVGDYELWEGKRLIDSTPLERLAAAHNWSMEMQNSRLQHMGLAAHSVTTNPGDANNDGPLSAELLQRVVRRGLQLADTVPVSVTEVVEFSNINYIYRAETPERSLYLKVVPERPKRFPVRMPRERVFSEAEGLRRFRKLAGSGVVIPEVLFVDEQEMVLGMSDEGVGRQVLFSVLPEQFDLLEELAESLGRALGNVHAGTRGAGSQRPEQEEIVLRKIVFAGLLAPGAMAVFPDLWGEVSAEMQAYNQCLIHADLWSKNLLVRKGQPVALVDFEGVCYADPAFDLATLIAVALLPALEKPALIPNALGFTSKMLDGWMSSCGSRAWAEEVLPRTFRATACFLAARGFGPFAYSMNDRAKDSLVRLAKSLAVQRPADLKEFETRVIELVNPASAATPAART